MDKKSYWIWYWGEYEIFHTMSLNLRRETRGYHIPPFWKISTPFVSVKFRKEVSCSSVGYLLCHIHGEGHVTVDGRSYPEKTRIALTSGRHIVEVKVSNRSSIPAIFVESDVCPSDESWVCNYHAGYYDKKYIPVGTHEYFDSVDKDPDTFPFAYEKRYPQVTEALDGGVLYDFGTELFGYLNINGVAVEDSLEIYYGESREEALDTEYSYITDAVAGQNDYCLRQRAFRYIYLRGASETAELSADYEYIPFENEGNARCDNSLMNDILSACTHTFRLNCRENFLDGIKRDRWVWGGDAYQSARANAYLFGDKDIEQRTLIGLVGKEPITQHINLILDYSLFWIIELYEHYIRYGDKTFLSRIYPMAEKLLSFCETRLNDNGLIEGTPDDWIFIDWSSVQKKGAVSAEQMLLIGAYRAMASIAQILEYDISEEYRQRSELLLKRVNEYYWDDERGAYLEGFKQENPVVTRHANVFAVMYDVANEYQKQRILECVFKNDSIPPITTPYFKGYELDALAKLGELEMVEKQILSYWGGMIELGAKTIWEEYDPQKQGIEHYAMYGGKYEKSLCHAWGAGPIYLFGRYYLGVYPTSAGYRTFAVEPQAGGFGRIAGSVPINNGRVTVDLGEKVLSVRSTVAGGELIWGGKRYALKPDETVVIALDRA